MAFEIFDVIMDRLHRKMKFESAAHEVTVHNIANTQNKDYIPLRFDEELEKAVKKQDTSGVILEEEMDELDKHSTKYGTYVKLLTMKLANLRTVVTQGRR